MKTLEERFWEKVAEPDENGCRIWQGALSGGRYGTFWIGDRSYRAHRIAYEWEVGPIPPGMHIDHICHVTACVAPEHLRAVTHKQNHENRRGANAGSASRYLGVTQVRPGRWIARAGHHGQRVYAGVFGTEEAAGAAAQAARIALYSHNDRDRA